MINGLQCPENFKIVSVKPVARTPDRYFNVCSTISELLRNLFIFKLQLSSRSVRNIYKGDVHILKTYTVKDEHGLVFDCMYNKQNLFLLLIVCMMI